MFFVQTLKASALGMLSLLILTGCTGHVAYDTLSAHLTSGDCDAAIHLVEESCEDYGSNSQLLFLLDSAMVHMQCRNFETAQERFQAAEDLAGQLWTISLSREAASLMTNDYLLTYRGEDYERAMIHIMSAIAYLDAKKPDEALVEFRRLDSLLALYSDRYDEKNVYKEDAFGRYLSGILNEADQEMDAAFIDYQNALKIYADYERYYDTRAPQSLKEDFFRLARVVDRVADARELLPDYVPDSRILHTDTRALGKIVFIQLSGRAPVKTEKRLYIPTRHGTVSLAFPRLVTVSHLQKNIRLFLKSEFEQKEFHAELAADINAIAMKNLEDRKSRIIAKTIARAVAKQAVIRQAAKNDNKDVEKAIEATLNLLNSFLEHADLRSWQTLPAGIYMGRIFADPGVYELEIPSLDNTNRKIKKILVKAGEIHYIIVNDSPGL